MSVQLIVYPQIYEGFSTNEFNLPVEMVGNGNDYVNVADYTSSYPAPSSTLSQQAITALFPPTFFNTWYGFFTVGTYGAPAYDPTLDLAILFGQGCGILQNLTNLTPGLVYNLEITVNTSTPFVPINIDIFNEDVLDTAIVFTPTSAVTTVQFTAPNFNYTVLSITNINALESNLILIENVSVMAADTEPSGDATILGDGQVILDLYEEEDIPLTLSVEDFKNVAENVASYSKAFNLPATKRNNKAFDSIFEITRDYKGIIFNPYQKTECILKQDGFLLFKGYLRLLDVTDKLGEISYNVNLYSEVVALADILKDRAFRDLDFTELAHAYNKDNIKNSWNDSGTGITYLNASTSGFRNAFSTVKYPFVDWNHQFIEANNPGAPPALGPYDNTPQLTSLETSFRPFINIKYIIDRIFEASDFTYESDFITTDDDFNKLYMDFNWGGDNIPSAINDTYLARWNFNVSPSIPSNIGNNSFKEFHLIPQSITPSQAPSALPPNYNASTNIITATTDNEIYDISYSFLLGKTSATDEIIECRWLHNSTPIDQQTISFPAANTIRAYTGNLQIALQTGDTLSAQFKGDTDIRQNETFASSCVFVQSSATISNTTLRALRGDLGQWDFLKGLITMFNLVTLVDEDNPNNIIIEPYGEVFVNTISGTSLASRGIQHNWTDKIDVSEMKLEPLADLNKKTIFKFVEDDDDYAFNVYKSSVGGHLYGSKEYDSYDSFDILEGTKEIVAEPFAATFVKPLMDQFPEFITPAIYARGSDGTWEGFENSPRIMYNNGIKATGTSYYIPPQNGLSSENQTNFLQFSHLTDIPTINGTRDFHFGESQIITAVGTPTPENLFNIYWLPYYSQLYNPNTRLMTIKVNLNASDINLFKFNDKVFLKNRTFRVNKIDYKPNDLSTVEFILII